MLSAQLAVAGDHVAAADDQGSGWVVHDGGGDGIGGDHHEIGGSARRQPGDSVIGDRLSA